GHTFERTFQSSERFVRARLEFRNMQYLYNDGSIYYFMDQESYEQTSLDAGQLDAAVNYLKEGMSLQISNYKGEVIGVEMPITVELAVTQTDPGFKGDTATGATKQATLETGITVQVPLFVNEGDVLKIDTRNGSYLERA
ncbi:MAG: elongation factor P, partial [Dehalococcoidales bacterium]